MCYNYFLKKIIPCPDIKKYKKFLFIGAHACDIEKGAGATACKLAKEGKEVKFVICTDSVGLSSNDNQDTAKSIHEKESLASATVLGIKEVEFLQFKSFSQYSCAELRDELIKVIIQFKPDVVLIDDITTFNEINMDDRIVSKTAEEVILYTTNKLLMNDIGEESVRIKAIAYYNTLNPNYYINIIGFLEQKIHSVLIHNSLLPRNNTSRISYIRSYKSLIKLTAYRAGFKSAKLQAESFRVVSITSTHNMPQINY